MGQGAGKAGLWEFARGGMGQIAGALADSARRFGAEIRTHAEVAQVLLRDSRACGVVVAGGEEIHARVVASNADPKRTFLKMVPADALPAEFVREVHGIRMDGVAMKINLATDSLPQFRAAPSTGRTGGIWAPARAAHPIQPILETAHP